MHIQWNEKDQLKTYYCVRQKRSWRKLKMLILLYKVEVVLNYTTYYSYQCSNPLDLYRDMLSFEVFARDLAAIIKTTLSNTLFGHMLFGPWNWNFVFGYHINGKGPTPSNIMIPIPIRFGHTHLNLKVRQTNNEDRTLQLYIESILFANYSDDITVFVPLLGSFGADSCTVFMVADYWSYPTFKMIITSARIRSFEQVKTAVMELDK